MDGYSSSQRTYLFGCLVTELQLNAYQPVGTHHSKVADPLGEEGGADSVPQPEDTGRPEPAGWDQRSSSGGASCCLSRASASTVACQVGQKGVH